jgi:hypothetical protein
MLPRQMQKAKVFPVVADQNAIPLGRCHQLDAVVRRR